MDNKKSSILVGSSGYLYVLISLAEKLDDMMKDTYPVPLTEETKN